MASFDGEPPTLGGGVILALSTVLLYPLLPVLEFLPHRWFPGLLGYVPFALNSLLWGAAMCLAVTWLRARSQRKPSEA